MSRLSSIDVLVVCFGDISLAYSAIAAVLSAGKFVVTANKAAVAAHGTTLCPYTRGENRRLWYLLEANYRSSGDGSFE